MIHLEATRNKDRVLIVEKGKFHPSVSFSRGSPATMFNSAGVLVTVTNNTPRFAYDVNGVYLGLLIEESRTNRALRSRDMTNATWVKSNMTTAQTATGLDAITNSCTQITATAANATVLQTITDATSRARATSFDIKRVTGVGNIDITTDNGTTWTTCAGLSNSTFTRYTVFVTNTDPVIGVRIVTSGDVVIVDYAQCEDGVFATSRIATTTAAVARPTDIPKITNLTGIRFNASEGSLYCEVVQGFYGTAQQTYFALTDGTGNNRIQIRRESKTTVNVGLIITGGVGQSSIVQTAGDDGLVVKMAMRYKLNDIAGSANGMSVSTDTAATIPTITQLEVGCFTSGALLNGHIKFLAYYPKGLPNVEYPRLST